jgi:hypothetical protein
MAAAEIAVAAAVAVADDGAVADGAVAVAAANADADNFEDIAVMLHPPPDLRSRIRMDNIQNSSS